ncbi:MAG: hypothetical protein P4L42_12440 [Desulfocapsaceae bacterium]|nr:hypothetical protein [Desulfocapsaceae bacterium]
MLERFILRLRVRVEERLWSMLGRGLIPDQKSRLQDLLAVEKEGRTSLLDHITFLGRYYFLMTEEAMARGELRPLRSEAEKIMAAKKLMPTFRPFATQPPIPWIIYMKIYRCRVYVSGV